MEKRHLTLAEITETQNRVSRSKNSKSEAIRNQVNSMKESPEILRSHGVSLYLRNGHLKKFYLNLKKQGDTDMQ